MSFVGLNVFVVCPKLYKNVCVFFQKDQYFMNLKVEDEYLSLTALQELPRFCAAVQLYSYCGYSSLAILRN